MVASAHFSGHSIIPLVLEKAAADWPQGRLDAVRLLADCLKNGGTGFHPRGTDWPFLDFCCLASDEDNESDTNVCTAGAGGGPLQLCHISAFMPAIATMLVHAAVSIL
ncbi:unnamed protein product [Protopolystoma xenopodis]|uniref:Uncharacterized protein n=1 Tax=Protopolystoma xenopodis TaxID=117903 RepID=A0A3S5AA75_9PLAT|nr:unnamed protein product [Protopolystoma xenopodis]